jgi:hypothetical protein
LSRGGVALLAGGVFVSVFAASWWGLPLLRADRAASTTGLGVHAAWAPANLKLQKGKALDPKSRAARDRETEDAGLQIIAMAKGVKFPPDLVASARDDGPPNENYLRFATVAAGDGRSIACAARLDHGRLEHVMLPYTADGIDESDTGDPGLAQYLLSGCAQAMRDHGALVTKVQFMQTMMALLPQTPKYDRERRSMNEAIRAARMSPRR